MGLVKGGNEIITYDFTKSVYGYIQLNSPIIATTNTSSYKTSVKFSVLIDIGPSFVYATIESKDTFEFLIAYSKRYIDKEQVIAEKILTFFDPVPCRWSDTPSEDPGLIIQTVNYLHQINLVKYNSKIVLQGRHRPEDIKHLNGTGILIGKRGEKVAVHLPVPIKIDDRITAINIYTSNDVIKSIEYWFEGKDPYIYIWDNGEYIKKFDMMSRESTSLKLVDEYYTFEGFTGKESYKINDEMIFIKTLGVKLTNTVNMFSYESSSNRKYTPNLGINEETIDTEFPLISQNVLLFCGKTRSKSPIFKPTKAIIIPSYQWPLFRLLPINQSKYLTNEFLYYWKSTGEEFVVYVLNRFDIDVVEFAFYRQNGKYENSIFLKMQGIRNYKDVKVIVSPNGRYVFYVEEEQEDDKDIPDSSRQNLRNKRQFIGKVSEIVTLRSKEQGIKMKNIVKHHKRSNPANLKQMLKESIDSEASFTLKAIQTIKDAGNWFSIFHHSFGNNDSMQLFVTDKGSIVFVDKVNNMLFFNNTDMSKACKNKLGLKEDGKTEYQIKDLNWWFSDNGLVGYSSEDAIYLEINLKRMKVKKIKKIAFKINKDKLFIKSIKFWPNSRYILIWLSTNYDELVLVIWDLKVNSEKFNLSLDRSVAYINKPGGCYGIILWGSYYINLDIGLMNNYFDHDFFDYPWTNKQQGFKMDRSENIILYRGELLMKEMYSECEVLQSLINGDTVYNEQTYSGKTI